MFGFLRLTHPSGSRVLLGMVHIVSVAPYVLPDEVASGQATLPWPNTPKAVVTMDSGQVFVVMQDVDDIEQIDRLGPEVCSA